MSERQAHWQRVYTSKEENQLSWHEDAPALSLALLGEAGLRPEMAVVDIGGGTSRLVDASVASKQAHITILDLSAAALDTAKKRLAGAGNVEWVAGDVTEWQPKRSYDLWHDRAAFHFLTDPEDQRAYVRVMARALKTGGRAVIGTFAPDGPEKCSGLPVARHDAASLRAVLGEGFSLISTRRNEHTTPWGAVQQFQFGTFEKLPQPLA
ncbi:class I SAM-dependent methyltransferase [Neoaquamicrobium sediminum]|uniref:class I SAM-dependent methyltransferase n=1 Tax=Neoaquamicrobium sediminum TaxID=1849104 RepID=UPI0015660535|nr:class I SAM-dependent methyltransferase [Mesorhizobium sediminum]NRC55238.1 class I SAM-dependent methyltransferase [Mesorhizobium sediminum]